MALRLVLLGDCMLGRLVNEVLETPRRNTCGETPCQSCMAPTGGSVISNASSRIEAHLGLHGQRPFTFGPQQKTSLC